jgi:hypothetical protein
VYEDNSLSSYRQPTEQTKTEYKLLSATSTATARWEFVLLSHIATSFSSQQECVSIQSFAPEL